MHPSELFKKFDIGKTDIQFLMNCAMIFTMPVIIDDKPSGNLPRHQDEVDRDKALQRYCKFDEAHRVLLSFCTYTGLSGGVGKTRVQFPIYRDDFTSPKNFWY